MKFHEDPKAIYIFINNPKFEESIQKVIILSENHYLKEKF